MGDELKAWIQRLIPVMAVCHLVYLIILVLHWFGFYNSNLVDAKDPVYVFGYISLAHLLAVPALAAASWGYLRLYLLFIIVQFIWLIVTGIMFILIEAAVGPSDGFCK